MSIIDDPAALELSRTLFLLSDAQIRAKGLLADIECWKQKTVAALGDAIVRCVETHGTLLEAEDKTWYRGLGFVDTPGVPGFKTLIEGKYGKIDWDTFCLPAILGMDRKKVKYFYKNTSHPSNFHVSVKERLSYEEKEAIIASRQTTPSA